MADDSPSDLPSSVGTLNPYHPPSQSASDDDVVDCHGKPRRPLGISILAVLHSIGSVGLIAIACFLLWNSNHGDGLNVLVGFLAIICSGLGLASAYGMWSGAAWGWWLSAWYYFIDALGHGVALMAAPFIPVVNDEEALEAYVIKHGGRFVITFLLTLYFMRLKVMRYFGLHSLVRWKAVCILLAVSATFLVLVSVAIAMYLVGTRGLPPALR